MIISLCGNKEDKEIVINNLKEIYKDKILVCNYLYLYFNTCIEYEKKKYDLQKRYDIDTANKMYKEVPEFFDSKIVYEMPDEILQDILVKYRVALQPNKQPIIWKRLCQTIEEKLDGALEYIIEKYDLDFNVVGYGKRSVAYEIYSY